MFLAMHDHKLCQNFNQSRAVGNTECGKIFMCDACLSCESAIPAVAGWRDLEGP